MVVRAVLCLLGLACGGLGIWMLVCPQRFQKLEQWWAKVCSRREKWYHFAARWMGMTLLLVGTVLFLVMLTELILLILF